MRTFQRNQQFAILRAVYLTGAATSMVWIIANYATASAVTIPLTLLGGVFLVLTIAAAINAARQDRFLRGSSVGVLSVGTQKFLRLVGLTIGIPPILYCAVFAFLVLTFDGKQNALNAVDTMIAFETQTFGKTVILDYVNALIRIRPLEPLPEPALVSTEIQPLESSPCAIYNPENANANPQPASWSPLQAAGPPNTLTPQADSPTAWASATRDGQDEWITLTYATPVIPSSIQIFEALSPGAVSRVCAYDANDNEIELWSGVDPLLNRQKTANADNSWNWSWVLPIPPAQRFETQKVTLYLSSMNVADWNEIDAVGLNTGDGIHWAVDATASSTYADNYGSVSTCGSVEPQTSYSNLGSGNPWYPVQATGAPDTTGYGDIKTAWASATKDDQTEWLEVEFGESLPSSQIEIYETYNPGAVYQVQFYGKNDRIVATWTGHDPTSPTKNFGVSKIPVPTDEPITKARLNLDSMSVKGWNEIDAVGLRDKKGTIHWAVAAKASTTYGVAQ